MSASTIIPETSTSSGPPTPVAGPPPAFIPLTVRLVALFAAGLVVFDLVVPSPILAWIFVLLTTTVVAWILWRRPPEVAAPEGDPPVPSLQALLRESLILGFTGFGGGLAVLSQVEHRLVEQRRWVPPLRFLEAAALAQSIPGPVATNALAIVCWRLRGTWGALLSVAGFVTPSFLMLLLAALIYSRIRATLVIQGIFAGLNPAMAGLILATAFRLGGRLAITAEGRPAGWSVLLRDGWTLVVLAASALCVGFAGLGVVETIILSGLVGILRATLAGAPRPLEVFEAQWHWLKRRVWDAARTGARTLARPWWRRWRAPGDDDLLGFVPWLALFSPAPYLLVRIGELLTLSGVFLRAGALTFGGGFVMIPLLEAELVRNHAWLDPQTFADAVALGQVTPGPVVITATFVGYAVAGLAGAVLATASVFLPAFIITLVLSGSVERFRKSAALQAFLTGTRPAVVGLMIAAAVTFGRHAIHGVASGSIAALALVAVWRFNVPPVRLLAAAGAVGIVWTALTR